jgi:hypothetical protein
MLYPRTNRNSSTHPPPPPSPHPTPLNHLGPGMNSAGTDLVYSNGQDAIIEGVDLRRYERTQAGLCNETSTIVKR